MTSKPPNTTFVARHWRVAKSLLTLRAQINAAWPTRAKADDGTIGDALHASRSSDHNPWIVKGGVGVVSALDVTHDPASGCDAGLLVAALIASHDQRVKYLIFNRRIISGSGSTFAWTWRSYSGSNPHKAHCHISVKSEASYYDSELPWRIR